MRRFLIWLGIIQPKEWHQWAFTQHEGVTTIYRDGSVYTEDMTMSFWVGHAIRTLKDKAVSIKYEPNGDVRIECDSIAQVEYEMNDLQMFAAGRQQKFDFNGPNPMTDGRYAAMGKLTNILHGYLKDQP